MARVIVGVFPDHLSAEHAIIGLKEAGFDPTHIGFMMRNSQEAERVASDVGGDVGTGAVTGGILGGALGAILAATGAFVIPGVGPFISAGILVTAIAGGAAGAIVGGLVGLGVPHEEAQYYNQRVVEGATLVTVDAPDREPEAREMLLRNGAEDTWSTTPWQSPAKRYNTQAGVSAESPRAATMTPSAEPLHRTAPITEPMAPTAAPNAESRGEQPGAYPVDRGSVVGPGDAVAHAGATNPFAGKLQSEQPSEGAMNYDEPALGQPQPPLAPNEPPPQRP